MRNTPHEFYTEVYIMNKLGAYGEVLATRFLRDHGHEIITTNFRCRFGEIDIISADGDTLVFTEVKTRISRFVPAYECVNVAKQKRIIHSAQIYVAAFKVTYRKFRFDIIEVYMKDQTVVEKIVQHKEAFGT